ncbi:MAG: UDP-glucose 4-epimerase [Syntrophomonadaceae bacterium]|nr:UDP-glucose 4-epimerase [Bacillota bacterium]
MILITGGLGFLGSNLAESLVKNGHEVVLVSRSAQKKQNIAGFTEKVTIDYGDVTDFDWIQGVVLSYRPDVIFHFAGQLTSYESFERPFYDVDVNSKSTLAILEAMRRLEKPCRFILGSTFWVIGKPTKLPINEETPCSPGNIYAADRLASEHYCKIYNAVYDLDTIVMRLTNTFGVREQYDNPRKAGLNYLLHRGFKGQTIPIYSEGKISRDYIYISDVVSAAEAIMGKGKAGECYFVGTGVRTWFYQIGKWIEELTPGKVTYVEPPDFHKRIDVGNIVIDNSKIKSLGWDWKVTVKEGLERTLDYYQQIGA